MAFSVIPGVSAADTGAKSAADTLYELGLFSGTGTNTDGSPIYELDRAPTRAEAITMLVRLLGKADEAMAGNWTHPFTDVPSWATPFVGYAYANGLTSGMDATTFGTGLPVTATQYLTFVLKALGYDSSTDFKWDAAWELSDRLGLTSGQYSSASNNSFLRGNVVSISVSALSSTFKDSKTTLFDSLKSAGEIAPGAKLPAASTPSKPNTPTGKVYKHTDPIDDGIALMINGQVCKLFSFRLPAGTYTVTVLRDGQATDDYRLYDADMSGYHQSCAVKKNADGTFTLDLKYNGEDSTYIDVFFPETVQKSDGTPYTEYLKSGFIFTDPAPQAGLNLQWCNRNISPTDGKSGFGSNMHNYYVLYPYFDGNPVTGCTVSAAPGASFNASIQADGSILLMKKQNGTGKFTVTYNGIGQDYIALFA